MALMKMPTFAGGGGTRRVQCGTFTAASGETVVPIDFKPSKIYVYKDDTMLNGTPQSGTYTNIVDEELSTAKQFRCYYIAGSWYGNTVDYPASSTMMGVKDVTASSFTLNLYGTYASNFAGNYHFTIVE